MLPRRQLWAPLDSKKSACEVVALVVRRQVARRLRNCTNTRRLQGNSHRERITRRPRKPPNPHSRTCQQLYGCLQSECMRQRQKNDMREQCEIKNEASI